MFVPEVEIISGSTPHALTCNRYALWVANFATSCIMQSMHKECIIIGGDEEVAYVEPKLVASQYNIIRVGAGLVDGPSSRMICWMICICLFAIDRTPKLSLQAPDVAT